MLHFSLLAYLIGLHKLSDRIFHLGPSKKCLNSMISGLDARVASQAISMQGLHDMVLCKRVRTNLDLTMKSDDAILQTKTLVIWRGQRKFHQHLLSFRVREISLLQSIHPGRCGGGNTANWKCSGIRVS